MQYLNKPIEGKNSWTKQELLDKCNEKKIKCSKNMTKIKLFELLTGKSVKKVSNKKEWTPKDLLTKMPISLTGMRSGDLLLGIRNVTKDAIIRVTGEDIPPYKKDLDILRQDKEIWNDFLERLGGIDFFSLMTTDERNKWMEKNQIR